jgi:hypothetical protein
MSGLSRHKKKSLLNIGVPDIEELHKQLQARKQKQGNLGAALLPLSQLGGLGAAISGQQLKIHQPQEEEDEAEDEEEEEDIIVTAKDALLQPYTSYHWLAQVCSFPFLTFPSH